MRRRAFINVSVACVNSNLVFMCAPYIYQSLRLCVIATHLSNNNKQFLLYKLDAVCKIDWKWQLKCVCFGKGCILYIMSSYQFFETPTRRSNKSREILIKNDNFFTESLEIYN